ncbi:unnamed protein product [Malus baccata var. baccata]
MQRSLHSPKSSHTMERLPGVLLFFLAILFSTTQAYEPLINHHIHLLRPKSGAGGSSVPGVSCLSWRLGVEVRNIINWKTVPAQCESYVGHYMLGHQYRKDSKAVTDVAWLYAKSLNLTKDGKNVWVFDIDETTLSNLPYYARHGFGTEVYNSTSFNEWVLEGTAPALPESLQLYKKLLKLGVKVVFITGRGEDQRSVTITNLKNVGYHTWEKLVLNFRGGLVLEIKSSSGPPYPNSRIPYLIFSFLHHNPTYILTNGDQLILERHRTCINQQRGRSLRRVDSE